MINLLIGIFFVYLILSMLASGIQEAVAGWIRLRGRMLLGAIEQMLTNNNGNGPLDNILYTEFKDNKWFQSLRRSKLTWLQRILPIKKDPSYLEDATFSSILLQSLGSSADIKKVKATIDEMPEGKLKLFLKDLEEKAEGDIEKLKENISTWYNSTMNEVSSWYKSRAHTMLFIIGFILSIILNADTFAIYNKLSNDPETQQQLVDLAQAYVDKGGFEQEQANPILNDTSFLDTNLVQVQGEVDPVTELDSLGAEISRIVSEDLNSVYTPLGLGWSNVQLSSLKNPYWWFQKFLGILITSFAIAMGASFWFNLLKSLLNFRSKQQSTQQKE